MIPTRAPGFVNQRGGSLMEVIVAVGIMGILAAGMASMFDGQQKQIRALLQKQEMIELKNNMLRQLSSAAVCTWQLQDKRINVDGTYSELAPSPTVLNLTGGTLYAGPSSTSAPLAIAGQRLPASLARLEVAAVTFKNIYPTGNPNEYKGVVEVSFNASSLAIASHPIQVQQTVTVNPTDPPDQKRIVACTEPASSTGIAALTYAYVLPANQASGGYAGFMWRTVPLNVEKADTHNLGTLTGTQILLQAGTYTVSASVAVRSTNEARIRLRNVDSGTTLVSGTNTGAGSAMNWASPQMDGSFTLATPATVVLEVFQRSSDGHGPQPVMAGGEEVYATLHFLRLH